MLASKEKANQIPEKAFTILTLFHSPAGRANLWTGVNQSSEVWFQRQPITVALFFTEPDLTVSIQGQEVALAPNQAWLNAAFNDSGQCFINKALQFYRKKESANAEDHSLDAYEQYDVYPALMTAIIQRFNIGQWFFECHAEAQTKLNQIVSSHSALKDALLEKLHFNTLSTLEPQAAIARLNSIAAFAETSSALTAFLNNNLPIFEEYFLSIPTDKGDAEISYATSEDLSKNHGLSQCLFSRADWQGRIKDWSAKTIKHKFFTASGEVQSSLKNFFDQFKDTYITEFIETETLEDAFVQQYLDDIKAYLLSHEIQHVRLQYLFQFEALRPTLERKYAQADNLVPLLNSQQEIPIALLEQEQVVAAIKGVLSDGEKFKDLAANALIRMSNLTGRREELFDKIGTDPGILNILLGNPNSGLPNPEKIAAYLQTHNAYFSYTQTGLNLNALQCLRKLNKPAINQQLFSNPTWCELLAGDEENALTEDELNLMLAELTQQEKAFLNKAPKLKKVLSDHVDALLSTLPEAEALFKTLAAVLQDPELREQLNINLRPVELAPLFNQCLNKDLYACAEAFLLIAHDKNVCQSLVEQLVEKNQAANSTEETLYFLFRFWDIAEYRSHFLSKLNLSEFLENLNKYIEKLPHKYNKQDDDDEFTWSKETIILAVMALLSEPKLKDATGASIKDILYSNVRLDSPHPIYLAFVKQALSHNAGLRAEIFNANNYDDEDSYAKAFIKLLNANEDDKELIGKLIELAEVINLACLGPRLDQITSKAHVNALLQHCPTLLLNPQHAGYPDSYRSSTVDTSDSGNYPSYLAHIIEVYVLNTDYYEATLEKLFENKEAIQLALMVPRATEFFHINKNFAERLLQEFPKPKSVSKSGAPTVQPGTPVKNLLRTQIYFPTATIESLKLLITHNTAADLEEALGENFALSDAKNRKFIMALLSSDPFDLSKVQTAFRINKKGYFDGLLQLLENTDDTELLAALFNHATAIAAYGLFSNNPALLYSENNKVQSLLMQGLNSENSTILTAIFAVNEAGYPEAMRAYLAKASAKQVHLIFRHAYRNNPLAAVCLASKVFPPGARDTLWPLLQMNPAIFKSVLHHAELVEACLSLTQEDIVELILEQGDKLELTAEWYAGICGYSKSLLQLAKTSEMQLFEATPVVSLLNFVKVDVAETKLPEAKLQASNKKSQKQYEEAIAKIDKLPKETTRKLWIKTKDLSLDKIKNNKLAAINQYYALIKENKTSPYCQPAIGKLLALLYDDGFSHDDKVQYCLAKAIEIIQIVVEYHSEMLTHVPCAIPKKIAGESSFAQSVLAKTIDNSERVFADLILKFQPKEPALRLLRFMSQNASRQQTEYTRSLIEHLQADVLFLLSERLYDEDADVRRQVNAFIKNPLLRDAIDTLGHGNNTKNIIRLCQGSSELSKILFHSKHWITILSAAELLPLGIKAGYGATEQEVARELLQLKFFNRLLPYNTQLEADLKAIRDHVTHTSSSLDDDEAEESEGYNEDAESYSDSDSSELSSSDKSKSFETKAPTPPPRNRFLPALPPRLDSDAASGPPTPPLPESAPVPDSDSEELPPPPLPVSDTESSTSVPPLPDSETESSTSAPPLPDSEAEPTDPAPPPPSSDSAEDDSDSKADEASVAPPAPAAPPPPASTPQPKATDASPARRGLLGDIRAAGGHGGFFKKIRANASDDPTLQNQTQAALIEILTTGYKVSFESLQAYLKEGVALQNLAFAVKKLCDKDILELGQQAKDILENENAQAALIEVKEWLHITDANCTDIDNAIMAILTGAKNEVAKKKSSADTDTVGAFNVAAILARRKAIEGSSSSESGNERNDSDNDDEWYSSCSL